MKYKNLKPSITFLFKIYNIEALNISREHMLPKSLKTSNSLVCRTKPPSFSKVFLRLLFLQPTHKKT